MLAGNYGKYKVIHTATQNNHHKVIILDHKDNENVEINVQHTFKRDENNSGLFHLAEHLLFNNIKLGEETLSNLEIINYLKPRGVRVNASTDHDLMRIHAVILTPKTHPKMQWVRKFTNFENNVSLAIEFLNNIHTSKKLEESTLKKEKKIVVSELNMYGEDAYKDEVVEAYLAGTNHNVVGRIEEVEKATRPQIQNILNHIYSGELLDAIYIKCDMTRHAGIIEMITRELNIDNSIAKVLRPRKNVKTGDLISYGAKIEKHRLAFECKNIPKGHAKIKSVEPIYLSENYTKLYVGFEMGCNYKKSESVLTATKKCFMLNMLVNELLHNSNFGLGDALREKRGLIYGFSNRIYKAEKATEYHNIPGLSTSIIAHATLGLTIFDNKKIEELRDMIFNDILSKLSEQYIASVTPAYFENLMRSNILTFSNGANYDDIGINHAASYMGMNHQDFNTNYFKQRVDTISREEYILFAKDVISKIQWNIVAI